MKDGSIGEVIPQSQEPEVKLRLCRKQLDHPQSLLKEAC